MTDEYNDNGTFVPVMTWTVENIVVGKPVSVERAHESDES